MDGSLSAFCNLMTDKNFYEVEVPQWQLINQFMQIKGYNCQMAKGSYGGRDFEIWFTPEIPIQDGPFVFKNLPGLVLNVNDTKNHYVFELLSIVYNDVNVEFETFVEGSNATKRTEFMKMKKRFNENIVSVIEQAGFVMEESQKSTYIKNREQSRRLNINPLELE